MPEELFIPMALAALMAALVLKPGRIVFALIAGMMASQAFRLSLFDNHGVMIGAFLIDLAVIVTLGEPYMSHPDKRARTVAMIGGMKLIGHAWAYTAIRGDGGIPHMVYTPYAWGICLAYLAQVAVAGGFFDGVGRRLDDYLRRSAPRVHHALWNVEG